MAERAWGQKNKRLRASWLRKTIKVKQRKMCTSETPNHTQKKLLVVALMCLISAEAEVSDRERATDLLQAVLQDLKGLRQVPGLSPGPRRKQRAACGQRQGHQGQ